MVSGSVAPALSRLDLAPIQVVSISFFIGALGGIGWQVCNRRDFVDRFLGWAVAGAFVMLVAVLPSGEFDGGSTSAGSVPGVVAGVVLAEGWMRQKPRP